jgi:hypothetical protein
MSMHSILLHIVVHTKMCLSENERLLYASRYFHFAASMLCPLRVKFSLVATDGKAVTVPTNDNVYACNISVV